MRNSFGPPSRPSAAVSTSEEARPSNPRSLERPLTNWWLRHTSVGWEQPYFGTIAQRELARRSRLISWIILGLLVGMAILSPLTIEDARARLTIALWVLGFLGAAALNRQGQVTLAGSLLVLLLSGGILLANLASPIGLTMGELPNFDAYVVSVVLAATVLPRISAFLVAAGNSLLIVGNYLYQPHNANIQQDAHLYSSTTVQTVSFLVRPVALQFVLAVIAYLWIRGTDEAIRRADRAEDIAALEHRERERTFALEEGVRYLHQTLAEWAAGNTGRRVPQMPVDTLDQVRVDLNTFMDRFAGVNQANTQLHRFQVEAWRLTAALNSWVRGQPVVWPTPSGTPLDQAILLLHSIARGQTTGASATPRPDSPFLSSEPRPTSSTPTPSLPQEEPPPSQRDPR